MSEIWKPVPSTENLIEVSSLGRVRRIERDLIYKDGRRGKLPAGIMRGTVSTQGYLIVSLGKKRFPIHRLVAEAFHSVPKETAVYQTVNHKNGDKLDNRPENVEWATYTQNNRHARDTGLCKQHGENTNLSKYSDQFIQAIRNVHAAYSPNWEELGSIFGITGTHARQIVLMLTRKKKTQQPPL